MRQSRKKKRSRPKNPTGDKGVAVEEESQECKVLKNLMEAFSSVSLEEAASAYREANGDPNKAAELLVGLVESASVEATDDQGASCSSSSSGSTSRFSSSSGSTSRFSSSVDSSSEEMFMETSRGRDGIHGRGFGGSKQKKVIAASGTVSTVLGKEYVSSGPRKGLRMKGHFVEPANKEDSEQFLISMLGEDCELSMDLITDVLCQCGYDVEKALDALLELAAPSFERSKNGHSYEHFANKEYARRHHDIDSFTDRASDSTSYSSEIDIQDNIWPMFRCSINVHSKLISQTLCECLMKRVYVDRSFQTTALEGVSLLRNFAEVLAGVKAHTPPPIYSETELSQKVLDSLFSKSESSQREPNNMNWKDVAKKMESLGHRFASDAAEQKRVHGKADEYQELRKSSRDHWDSMKSYYQKAATAFSNGEKEYAAYLSEQGRSRNTMAREADEKASHEIFKARNKSIENVVTIDLHGQHVKQAIRLLKVHLLFGVYASSVQIFRVITGCGSHGVGRSKLKQAAINLIEREGIQWSEENRGTILIKLDGRKEFSFLESESDSDE